MKRTRTAAACVAAGVALSTFACGGPKGSGPQAPVYTGPVAAKTSGAGQREKVSVTIYNGGFGLVREIRNLDLSQGRVALEYRDVAEHIQPETVSIKSLDDPASLSVFEQNYRYDLLTPQKLLEKYVGKKVRLHRYNQESGKEEDFDAEVVSFNENTPVYKVNGEITYGWPGRVSFPDVPPNLIAKPTLVWLLGTQKPKQKVEVTYITQQIGWKADYVLTVDANDALGDLTGWVTLNNETGTEYDDAELKLVAGNVQRLTPETQNVVTRAAMEEADVAQKQFREESFFEYHLYTLDRPTTMLDHEQKQVTLLQASGIGLHKKLLLVGNDYYYRSRTGEIASNQKLGVYLEIENKEANHLGMPLPKGILRVYKADSQGAKQFVGEDEIDHTPRDEKLKVKLGEAFDVVADRRQMSWTPLGGCSSESEWEISIRNHKDVPADVEDVEPVGGDWTIVSSSHPWTKKDAATVLFDVTVPPRGETKITYRIRVRWC